MLNSLDEKEVKYLIDFLMRDLPFSQRVKIYKKAKRMQTFFSSDHSRPYFPGYKALDALDALYRPELELTYKPLVLAGRLANGAERGQGEIVHAVKDGTALCGAEPGRRSAGWVNPYAGHTVTCHKCLTRIETLRSI